MVWPSVGVKCSSRLASGHDARSRMVVVFVSAMLLLALTGRAAEPRSLEGPSAGPSDGEIAWTGEIPVSARKLVPSSGYGLSVAFSGSVHLVVWNRGNDVVGVRVANDGTLLDEVPFLFSESAHPNRLGGVVWNGECFLIVWISSYQRIIAKAADADGVLADHFVVGELQYAYSVHVASNGSTTLVAAGGAPLHLIRRDGTVLTVSAPSDFGGKITSSVATDGHDYLATFIDNHGVPMTRVARIDGETGSAEMVQELPQMWHPQAVPSAEGYLVFSGGRPLTATPLDSRGRLSGGTLFLSDDVAWVAYVSSLRKSDGSVMVTWQAPRASFVGGPTMLTTIDATGVRPPAELGPEGVQPVLSGDGESPLLVWRDEDSLRHGLLDPDRGVLTTNAPTSQAAPHQQFPAVVATRTGWFTVWSEGSATIKAALVSRRLTSGPDFVVAEGIGRYTKPAVATNGRVVLVVWYDAGGEMPKVLARRYDMSGNALDAAPIVVAEIRWNDSPALTWNGEAFLVAYSADRRVLVNRVAEDGSVLDGDGRIVAESFRAANQTRLAIASGSEGTLLVWQDGDVTGQCVVICDPPPPARIEGVLLSGDGMPRGATQTILVDAFALGPVLVARGREFLLAWVGLEAGGRVFSTIVTADGTRPAVGARNEVRPLIFLTGTRLAAAAEEAGFVLAWSEGHAVNTARLGPEGALREQWQLAPPESRGSLESGAVPAVAARDGDLLVLYSRWTQEDGGVPRVFLRGLLQPEPRRRGVRR
jgi:hypothetical protein